MLKLTKKIAATGTGLRLSKCGEWITNGHWAAKREIIEGGHLLTSQDALYLKYGNAADQPDVKPPDVEKLREMPDQDAELLPFVRQRWIYRGKDMEHALYAAPEEHGHHAFVNRVYADWLDRYESLLAEVVELSSGGRAVRFLVDHATHPCILIGASLPGPEANAQARKLLGSETP